MIQVQKLRCVDNGFYRKVIAFILFFMVSSAAPLQRAEIAYIFQDENLGRQGYWLNTPRFVYEVYRYTNLGYAVRIIPATEKNILEAILDSEQVEKFETTLESMLKSAELIYGIRNKRKKKS